MNQKLLNKARNLKKQLPDEYVIALKERTFGGVKAWYERNESIKSVMTLNTLYQVISGKNKCIDLVEMVIDQVDSTEASLFLKPIFTNKINAETLGAIFGLHKETSQNG